MNIETALQGLNHFFNDFIGAVVPGFVFLAGIILMYKGLLVKQELSFVLSNDYFILVALALSFTMGHVLLAVYKDIIENALVKIKYKEHKIISSSKEHIELIETSKR